MRWPMPPSTSKGRPISTKDWLPSSRSGERSTSWQLKARFKTDGYADFEKRDLNNAVLLAYRRYFHDLEKFEAFYQKTGSDLRKVIEFFLKVQASEDRAGLNSFLEGFL